MPIGDLLAQIGGGKSQAGAPVKQQRPVSLPAKRKPEQELRPDGPKTPRFESTPKASTTPSSRPISTSRPSNTPVTKPSSSSASRNAYATQKAAPPVVAAKAAPKKGSFAEILARGKRAQVSMGQVGRIQHKKVEGMAKKPRDEYEEAPPPPKRKAAGSGYSGTGKASSGSRKPSTAAGRDTGYQGMARPKAGGSMKKKVPEEPEKKVKKAATATTGYSGTSRPRPGNPTKKTSATRGGALLNGPTHRHGASKSKYDDYDEELDDFIEYDDEEDDGYDRRGPRYDYRSDDSSDMEAGMDDIDGEEESAARIARREDVEEQRREARLKAEKEERRRRFMAGR